MRSMSCLVAAALIVCSLAVARAAETDVKSSWDNAVVYMPNADQPIRLGQLKADKPCPVAIFVHGCDGMGSFSSENHGWAKWLAQQGVLVVAPDSLARNDRKPSCDPKTQRSGLFPPVHAMRQEEIKYAAEEIRKQPWFDGKNLFLMGFSEGCVAVVRTKLSGFRGVIATACTCTNTNNPAFNGIFLPPDTPLLTISYTDDTWFKSDSTRGTCESKFEGRTHAKSVTIPGRGHGTYNNDQARQAVAGFIRQLLQSP